MINFLTGLIITPCACTRGKAIGFVRWHLLSSVGTKIPDLDISEQSVSTTKPSKTSRNLLAFALNHIARLTQTLQIMNFLFSIPL